MAAPAEGDPAGEEREMGDLLLSVVNLARRREMDPEVALRERRALPFPVRPRLREGRRVGREESEAPMAELDRYWEEAKSSQEGVR